MYVWTDDRDSQRHIIYVRSLFGFILYFWQKTDRETSYNISGLLVLDFLWHLSTKRKILNINSHILINLLKHT